MLITSFIVAGIPIDDRNPSCPDAVCAVHRLQSYELPKTLYYRALLCNSKGSGTTRPESGSTVGAKGTVAGLEPLADQLPYTKI